MASKNTQFKKGSAGGPGRPKGSRNKVSEEFLKVLAADFAEHGKSVIERVRKEDPAVYIRIVAQLVPKGLEIQHGGNINVSVVNYQDDDKQVLGCDRSQSVESEKHPGLTLN